MAVRPTNPYKAHVHAGPLDGHRIVAGDQLPNLFEVWEPPNQTDANGKQHYRVWVYVLANGAPESPAGIEIAAGDAPAYVDADGFGVYEGIDSDRRV